MASAAYDNSHPAVLPHLDGQTSTVAEESGSHEQKDQPHPSAATSTHDHEQGSEKHSAGDSDETRSIEMEQSIGVTKIEALYIVFGRGWKLVGLWL